MINIPAELDAWDEYWPPELGGLYWVKAELFGRPDSKPKRPYVVIALPKQDESSELLVVRRSTSARAGIEHDPQPAYGLRRGWFCELRNVSKELWTLKSIEATGYVLPEDELAWVMGTFL